MRLTEPQLASIIDAPTRDEQAAADDNAALVALVARDPLMLQENALDRSNGRDHSALFMFLCGDADDLKSRITPRVSRSELDLEFASLLATYATRDPELLAACMEESPHHRPKWREKRGSRTWLQQTIARALRDAPDRTTAPIIETAAEIEAEPIRARSLREILANPDATKPPAAVVPCLAWQGRITLVAAWEGVGKSTLFAAAAAAVTTGAEFLGDPCARGVVLWITAEEHPNDVVIRALRFDTPPGDELYVLERADDPLSTLDAEVTRLHPVLVVIDSLHAWAAPLVKDKSQSDDWLTVMGRLDRIARAPNGPAVLLAAQAQRSTGDYRDSGAIGHGVDVVLNLTRPDENGTIRVLKRRKARWELPDVGVRLTDDGFERTSAKQTLADRLAKVRAQLTEEWQTAEQIAPKLKRKTVWRVRNELVALHEADPSLADQEGTGGHGDPFRFRTPHAPALTPVSAGGACGMSATPAHVHKVRESAGAEELSPSGERI